MATFKDDYVVKYFNTYNYTVYAPNNDAMAKAYAAGLPRWDKIVDDYEAYEDNPNGIDGDKLKERLRKELKLLRQFARYHFQNNTVFADNFGEDGNYATFMPNSDNINQKLGVSIAGGTLTVTDAAAKAGVRPAIEIKANASGKVVNEMTRDVILDARYDKAKTIYTSSFAVVHQISTPLNAHQNSNRYDGAWTGAGARERLAAFRQQFESYLYKRYEAN